MRRGEEAGGLEGQPGARDGGEREKIQNGQTGIRGLKARVGRECSISRGGQIVQWRFTCWMSPRSESQCYEWAAARVRATKSSEFGEGKL